MEYVEGEALDHRLGKGPIPLDEALEYSKQIADALDRAHRQGIVHRDLKPANVMITKAGVKLLDFGLAKLTAEAESSSPLSQLQTQGDSGLTAEGTIMGTFRYMAPEQVEGKDVDARTDIYALCLVIYEMITGQHRILSRRRGAPRTLQSEHGRVQRIVRYDLTRRRMDGLGHGRFRGASGMGRTISVVR